MPPGNERPRLADILYHDLLAEISASRLSGGQRLPSEAELGQRFGVSRPVVRQALARLREEGIITSARGSGSYVSIDVQPAPERLSARRISSLSEVQSLYQFREFLEGEAAHLAAETRTDAQMEAIMRAARNLEEAALNLTDGTEEDIAFHRSIAIATNNRFFVDALDQIRPDMEFIVQLGRALISNRPAIDRRAVHAEHGLIAQAIQERDCSAARKRMQFHIRTAQARIFWGDSSDGRKLWSARPPV